MENQNLYPIIPPNDKMATAPSAPVEPPPSYEQISPTPSRIYSPHLQPLDPAAMNRGPPHIIIQNSFGNESQVVYCTNCGESQMSRLAYEPGIRTHIIALMLCFSALWLCACAPYFCCSNPLCQNTTHYCKNCGAYLGSNRECC